MSLPDRPLRLGTRASPLALAQAHLVRDALMAVHAGLRVEIVTVVATGDRIQDRPLADVGGKALWTKELDAWLESGDIDFAVHSMKDVETIRPPEFMIAAMLRRADVRDRLIGAASIAQLPLGAVVGTSAPRRTAQLLRTRPDLQIVLFRGNVQTRLRKLESGEAQATLLAAAGLERLGLEDIGVPIGIDVLLPAPAQGAIGVEALQASSAICDLLGAIDHSPTHQCVAAERALLAELNAGCRSPVAALAVMDGDAICLHAEILSENGAASQSGKAIFLHDDHDGPARLARQLLDGAPSELRGLFG